MTAFDFSERWGKPRTQEELAESTEATNLWESLLERGFRKSRSPDSNVVFVGDAGCGKATLVSRLCASRTDAADFTTSSAAGVLAYNFVDAVDPTEVDADEQQLKALRSAACKSAAGDSSHSPWPVSARACAAREGERCAASGPAAVGVRAAGAVGVVAV